MSTGAVRWVRRGSGGAAESAWKSVGMSAEDPPVTATGAAPSIWFDDLEVGEVFDLGTVVAEREEVIEFARRYDPQWYHVNEAAAKSSSWGQLIASGWWTGSAMMRLYVDGFLSKIAPDASPGFGGADSRAHHGRFCARV